MELFLRYARKTTSMPNHFPTKAYDARFLFVLDGKSEIRIEDKTFPLTKNTLCYYPAGTEYFPVPPKENLLSFVTVNFDLSANYKARKTVMSPVSVDEFDKSLALLSHQDCGYDRFKNYFVLPGAYFLRNFFIDMASEFERNTDIANEIAESLLKCIVLKLAEHKNDDEKKLCTEIIDYISDHYHTLKSNSEIAKAFHYHPYYINTVFKYYAGTTLHRYIMTFRLKKGAELLSSTPKSINEIAYETGFQNPNHFSKRFSDEFGMSPSQFRNNTMFI